MFKIEQTSVVSFYVFGRGLCKIRPNVGKSFASKPQSSRTLNGLELTREINDLLLGKQRRLERQDDEAQK